MHDAQPHRPGGGGRTSARSAVPRSGRCAPFFGVPYVLERPTVAARAVRPFAGSRVQRVAGRCLTAAGDRPTILSRSCRVPARRPPPENPRLQALPRSSGRRARGTGSGGGRELRPCDTARFKEPPHSPSAAVAHLPHRLRAHFPPLRNLRNLLSRSQPRVFWHAVVCVKKKRKQL